jgi:hypothetical protein
MVDAIQRCGFGDELAIPRRQAAAAEPDHPVAVERGLPDKGVLRPALGIAELACDDALGDPPVGRKDRQVDMDERVCGSEPLPGQRHTVKAINDPLGPAEDFLVDLYALLMRDLAAARYRPPRNWMWPTI